MKTVAFVPVKLNNQRMPGKNTKKFDDGVTLLGFFLHTLLQAEGFDGIYVFCSDESVRKFIPEGVTFLKRPGWLDTQEATPQDIISEFMKRVEADIYAVCHCTSPFVSAEHFEECIESVKSGRNDSSFTGSRVQKLLWKAAAVPLNFDPANIPRTQDLEPLFAEVSAVYVFRKEVFEKTRCRVGGTPHITELKGIECIDIDYPEDFDMANAVYMGMIKNGRRGLEI